jgi:AraC-like DNA-binding protein
LDPIAHIAYASGFGDLSTFNRRFRETFGLSPKAFRARDRSYRPRDE